jgi:hypothetical protein
MKKILLIIAFTFWFWTISQMAEAQTVKGKFTELKTVSPVFYFIYEMKSESGEEMGTVELQIHDRKHQFVSMSFDRLNDQAKGNDPKNPFIKLIQIPEIDKLAFRQAESLEELQKPVDNLTVIMVRLSKLREASRIIYQ